MNQSSCTDVTVSNSGYYITTAYTSSSDNIFSECSECADGQYESAACTNSADTVCLDINECDPNPWYYTPVRASDPAGGGV